MEALHVCVVAFIQQYRMLNIPHSFQLIARGNVVPAAEFNYYLDPEAAFIVLNSLIRPITVLPLDVFNNQFTTVQRFENSVYLIIQST